MSAARSLIALTVCLAITAPTPAAVDPHLPADTQTYLSVNVREICDSDVFKEQLLTPARDLLKQAEPVKKALDDLGLDPFKHVDRLVIASPSSSETDRGLIVIYGTFDAEKFKARAEKLKKAGDDSMKVHDVPLGAGVRHPVYEVPVQGKELSVFVAVKDGKTLLASPGKDYVVDALKQARAKKPPVLKNKELQALIERLNPKQAVSIAMPGKMLAGLAGLDSAPPGTGDALEGIEAVGGGLTVGKEVHLDLAITAKSEENARNVRSILDRGTKLAVGGLALLAEDRKDLTVLYDVLKSVKVIGKGKVVGVSARLTADTLQDLFGKGG